MHVKRWAELRWRVPPLNLRERLASLVAVNVRRAVAASVAVSVAVLSLAACATQEDAAESDGTWVGTITTEGDVTSVVNESGSVWGGTARLVEDLSIGVAQGDEPYLFGQLRALWATNEQIYVLDAQVPAVRVYDRDGDFIRNIGRSGQGPGEDDMPSAVAVLPDGRVVVRSYVPGQRTNVYSPDGAYIDTWYGDPAFGTDAPPTVTYEGVFLTQARGVTAAEREERTEGMARAGPDGLQEPLHRFPSIDRPAPAPRMRVGQAGFRAPFWPGTARVMTPSAAMVIGRTDQYRIVVGRADGTTMIIRRLIDAIPVSVEEQEWERRRLVASARRFDPSFNWDGADIPAARPVFSGIVADRSRRIWVWRPSRVTRVPDCTADPLVEDFEAIVSCFEVVFVADVFDEGTGELLGEVQFPVGVDLWPSFIRDAELYAVVEDDAGTIMVKRYRLVLPGEE
jgi:hypothetical protein